MMWEGAAPLLANGFSPKTINLETDMKKFLLSLAIAVLGLPTAQAGITPDEIDQAASDVQPQVVE